MSYQDHTTLDSDDVPSIEGTGIFPVLESLPEAEASPRPARKLGPERWLMAGGTAIAMIAAFVAFTAGSPPVHAMPSPFGPAPASTTHARLATPATCPPVR
jgi:hypothetical protein